MPQQWKWKAIVRRLRPEGPLERAFRVRHPKQGLGAALDTLLRRTRGCSCPMCVHYRGAGKRAHPGAPGVLA